ncbi:sugar phosphate isomerase/epimerase family protein [Hydrogenophaga sp. OTU3427]|uniref:sugar phosphate isomerase/epimerase family protein n=1 Tax=Hydrogenophaga sp. OTU3427 TaxID=3043856 RepID=UPI00313AEA12
MQLSFSTSLLPELRSFDDIASRIAMAGFDGIEWRIHPHYHIAPLEIVKKAPELRAVSEAHGLKIPCLAGYLYWNQLHEIELMLEGARIMGCPRVRLAGFEYDETRTYAEVYDAALESMAKVIPLLKASGVAAVIETHFGTIHASAHGAHQLVRHFDPAQVGVIMDGSNLCVEGRENWKLMIEVLGPYLQHVHVRNTRWYTDESGAWKWHWAALDGGLVPWKEVFSLLKARGYSGFATSENMWGVPKQTTGYIGEVGPYMGGSTHARNIEERLLDIKFMRSIS